MNPTSFPSEQSTPLTLSAGQIQAVATNPKGINVKKVILICHPHPLHGGTMDNKVITTLARSFNQLGFKTLRFNFRGVGDSVGEHDNGIGEGKDTANIIQWLHDVLPDHELYLAGFSFGAYVAYQVAGSSNVASLIKQLLLVAPPVSYPEFWSLPEPAMPWFILQGDLDDISIADDVEQWAHSRKLPPNLKRFPEAGHFFHGQLVTLKNYLLEAFA